ncbi:GNAT family N-acetyltransferase [Paenibacillus agricola]|uniref:GNAT family N-acetyltransferase n=1 Tax=Paenibacillus agricola TaxID=2716264 RepID=A0ABX0JH54_9BACL|nr:GNAT family N-acetyltransferase [Paenibacillus agricola]NHN34609.1 GNAT family N-acetyltransferase [Paenibacillus agricola]
MNIIVQTVHYDQKSILRNLVELYKYDFSEYEADDVNEQGLYEYQYLDHYWTEDGRFAFFVRVDEKLAGFALVRTLGMNEQNQTIYSMAEFFIMKKYRRMGVGDHTAVHLFNLLPGVWKVGQLESNEPSQIFWKKVIGAYTNNGYEQGRREDHEGPLQTFVSKP